MLFHSREAFMRTTKILVLPLLLALFPGLIGDQLAPNVLHPPDVRLPLKNGSVRFAVIGDNGTGERPQLQVAEQMQSYWTLVKFDFVLMNGDNIYGGHKPTDFARKFELPYKPLLDENVKFYASLGNHDDPDLERNYKPYNMGGDRYYTFRKRDVQFFALDSNYMDPEQLDWLESQVKSSDAKWKIAFFHHPLFTSAKYHGSDMDLRRQLMPIFEKYGVNVVMSGHEHVYERIKPQSGIYFFVVGNSGELRFHNLRRPSDIDVVGFDTDRTFLLVEIVGDKLDFETVAATGEVIDSGELDRQHVG